MEQMMTSKVVKVLACETRRRQLMKRHWQVSVANRQIPSPVTTGNFYQRRYFIKSTY